MSIKAETNPVGAEDTVDETTLEPGAEVEQTETEDQFDDEGNPIIEEDEIDLDDVKLRVPKDQAEKVRLALLRQADYTRKTQELAEQRRSFETQAQTFQQASQQELSARAQVVAIDQQLLGYQNVNWAQEMATARANDDDERFAQVQQAHIHYQQLKDQRGQIASFHDNLYQQRVSQEAAGKARRIEEGRAILAKEIPGWSETKALEVLNGGVAEYGFDRSEIEDFEDPRMVKVLNDALAYRAQLKQQNKAKAHVAAQTSQPAANVKARSGPPAGLDDRLSTDEWIKRREAQLRKRG